MGATCFLHRLAGGIVTIKTSLAMPGIIDGPGTGIGGFWIALTMKAVLQIVTSPRNPENLQKVGLLKKLLPPIRPRPQSRPPLQRQPPPLHRQPPLPMAHQPLPNREQRPRLFLSPQQQNLPPQAEEETTEQIALPFFNCK